MILDFNKKEEFALNYFSEFLNKEFHLPFDTIQAFENDNPELTEELVFELKKPLDTAEKYQALLGRTTDYLKEMNSVLLQYYMDIETKVEKSKTFDLDNLERY